MTERRKSVLDVIELEEYQALLDTAARISDREESITCYFFLTMMKDTGLRVGEAIHMTEDWYHEERGVIVVPEHVDCDCGLCRHYAQQLVDTGDAADNLTFEDALEKYWSPKDGSSRHIPLSTKREHEIIQLYFSEVPYTTISYSTVSRRLKKVAEKTEDMDPEKTYPHMLRASGATDLAWAGIAPPALDQIFGWVNPNTKENYVAKSGFRARRELDRLRGNSRDSYSIPNNPETYTQMRQSADEYLNIDSWKVSSTVNTHPRYRDDEESLQEQLREYQDDEKMVSVGYGFIKAYFDGVGRIERWATERYSEHVEFDFFSWLKESKARRATFSVMFGVVSVVYLSYLFAESGIYINLLNQEVAGLDMMFTLFVLSIIAIHAGAPEDIEGI